MRTHKKRLFLTTSEKRALAASPGLQVVRYDAGGERAPVEQLTVETSRWREILA